MTLKPIFVSYLYMRKVHNNPSYERFTHLPAMEQERLLARLEARAKTLKGKTRTNVVKFVKRRKTA